MHARRLETERRQYLKVEMGCGEPLYLTRGFLPRIAGMEGGRARGKRKEKGEGS